MASKPNVGVSLLPCSDRCAVRSSSEKNGAMQWLRNVRLSVCTVTKRGATGAHLAAEAISSKCSPF
eukprot:CAMPEP_0181232724 /NCGR_PEP_ID=MMETSP1096-20121128/35908_1 /TAXON_ID=156174 ORGANISM="Chrysochromulina ericina, Strain CCMP281" /NCGR_SAMPLE_ID=MMETSP1096 /ASSEMBLY_ACC=CAM_ASM_000453 /LENGTH=65 /DNA_ID=CAMNT_0023327083 /DNA_START=257 /DNA_END=451 /DNA_ORIENTATION=-